MKEYKSNEELLDYLISKNVVIKNREDALEKIQKYSYYAIINTYKEVFKNGDSYKENVTFDEIFALYEFDKNLKAIFIKYALEIEVIIKALMANVIAEKYGVKDYLNVSNFDSKADVNSVNKLITQVNEEIEENYKRHPAITHYKDVYNFIPPFVLVKILTLGHVSRYYGLLKQEDRQSVSKYFKLSDKVLKQILINLTMARNISAHSDRLFTFHSKFFISFRKIDKNYEVKDKSTNLYMLVKCMERLLDKTKYEEFRKQITNELDKLNNELNTVPITDILKIMGFPTE